MKELIRDEERGADILYRRTTMEDGHPKKCECRKKNRSGEPDRDIRCSICQGLGYYFTDHLTRAYVNHSQAYAQYLKIKKQGGARTEYKTVYFEWDFLQKITGDFGDIPHKFDRVIQIQQDLDGNPLSPLNEREVYEILSVDPYRLDSRGRIEYYRLRVISIVDESFLV